MTQQGLRQASARNLSGWTTETNYNEDFLRLFDAQGVPAGTFNERQLRWINARMGASYTNLNDAMQAYATSQGADNWSAMGALEDRANFTRAMPYGVTYTRTGEATGLTSAGAITTFAADAPQRTDRGLALEPERTNAILNSGDATLFAGVNGCSMVKLTQTLPPFERVSLASANSTNNRIRAAAIPLTNNAVYTVSYIYELGTSGLLALFADGTVSAAARRDVDGVWSYEAGTNGTFSDAVDTVLVGSIRRVVLTFTAAALVVGDVQFGAGPNTDTGGLISIQHFMQHELGAFATSPVVSVGTALTRGLPVMTEAVPAGRTKALLTYADATTTLVTGLTPGDTFEYAETAIAAGKGRFGVSELVSRVWQA
jgi:hypothetical protein